MVLTRTGLMLTLGVLLAGPGLASEAPYTIVLGIAQDAGYPQAGTKSPAWDHPELRRLVACLGIVDPATGQRWMIDATPDFPDELHRLDVAAPPPAGERAPALAGILLTHAHIGHYTGLMYLGTEAIGAHHVPVWAMPRMRAFLINNGPWGLLVKQHRIDLHPLSANQPVQLNPRLTVTPILVPHRHEYSETVAFRVRGPERSVLYLPDIDKWKVWDAMGVHLEDQIAKVDVAYLDGTFFHDGEVPGRSMAKIPHPFIVETMARLAKLPAKERHKVHFIHLNRTNPLLGLGAAKARAKVEAAGFEVAKPGERVSLGSATGGRAKH